MKIAQGRNSELVFLPGGQDFLFLHRPDKDPEDAQVYLGTLQKNKVVDLAPLIENETPALYTPAGGGRLVFQRDDNIYCRKLNRRTRQLEGEMDLVVQGVASMSAGTTTGFSVARDETIAWRRGKAATSRATEFNRSGKETSTTGPPFACDLLLLSPDEKQLLAQKSDGSGSLMEVGRTVRSRDIRNKTVRGHG